MKYRVDKNKALYAVLEQHSEDKKRMPPALGSIRLFFLEAETHRQLFLEDVICIW